MNSWEGQIVSRLRVPFILLIFISAIYLITRKNDEKKLLGWSTIILFIMFNPFVVDILVNKFGLGDRIERFMWYIPFIIVSIVAIVDFIGTYKERWIGSVGFIIIIAIILPIGLHKVEIQKDDWNDMYCMSETELAIARILESEDNKYSFTVWSDALNLLILRQYLANIKNIFIDRYLVAENLSIEEVYGDYSIYINSIYGDYFFPLNVSNKTFVSSLNGLDVTYYILSENSSYEFLLEYNECTLIGTVNGYNVYRVEDMIY